MGINSLAKLQMGKESTAGTAVAATSIWRGKGGFDDRRVVKWVEENIGIIPGVDRSYIASLLAALPLDPIEATFEQLPYLFAMGVKNVVTGASDGVGTGKIYAYPGSTTAQNTIQTYTWEAGDNAGAEEAEYMFASNIKLTGKPNEALMMSGELIGRQIVPSTFTGALSVPTVEEILFNKGKLYIDPSGATFGSTLKSNTFLGFEAEWKTGIVPVFSGDGNLYFTFHKITKPEFTFKIIFEHDATSIAEKVNYRNQTTRNIRLQWEGNNVATGGTLYQKKTLRIDAPGRWEKFDKIDEDNGNDIVAGTFRAKYNATAAMHYTATVVNELATLP